MFSTFGIMGLGIDGLQEFCTYIVMLGEGWTPKDGEQGIARVVRVRRGSLDKPVDIYSIHGAHGSKGHSVWQRVQARMVLQLEAEK